MELYDIIIESEVGWGTAVIDLTLEEARIRAQEYINMNVRYAIVPAASEPD